MPPLMDGSFVSDFAKWMVVLADLLWAPRTGLLLVAWLVDAYRVVATIKWMSEMRMGSIFVPMVTAKLGEGRFDKALEDQAADLLNTAGAPAGKGLLCRLVCLRILQGGKRTKLTCGQVEILVAVLDPPIIDVANGMGTTSHKHSFSAPPTWEQRAAGVRQSITADDCLLHTRRRPSSARCCAMRTSGTPA